MFNRNGDLVEKGEKKKAGCPDTKSNPYLVGGWVIFDNFMQRIDYQPSQDKAETLVKPESNKNHQTADTDQQVVGNLGNFHIGKNSKRAETEEYRGPHKGYKIIVDMAVMLKSKKQVLQ